MWSIEGPRSVPADRSRRVRVHSVGEDPGQSKQWRLSLLVLLIPFLFIFFWTPYALLTFLVPFQVDPTAQLTVTERSWLLQDLMGMRIPPDAFALSSILAKCSYFANPVLYAFLDEAFRFPSPLC